MSTKGVAEVLSNWLMLPPPPEMVSPVKDEARTWKVPGPVNPVRLVVVKRDGARNVVTASGAVAPGARFVTVIAADPVATLVTKPGGAPIPAAKLKLSLSPKVKVWAEALWLVSDPMETTLPPRENATEVSVSVKPALAPLVHLSIVRTALVKSVRAGPNVMVSEHVKVPALLPEPAVHKRAP